MKNLLLSGLVLGSCSLVMMGCNSTSGEDATSTSDIDTNQILADYEAVMTDDDIILSASFRTSEKKLALASTDSVSVQIGQKSYKLAKEGSKQSPLYKSRFEPDAVPGNVTFTLTREGEGKQSSDFSVAPIPEGFEITEPVSGTQRRPSNGTLELRWTNANSGNTRVTILYAYNCQTASNATGVGTYQEVTDDDGQHTIDLNKVFTGQDFATCKDFDLAVTRERNGSLDSVLGGGTITGAQMRIANNMTLVNI